MESPSSTTTSDVSLLSEVTTPDVSLLSEVHRIIIPPIPCSFPWKNHPDYQQLTEMSDAWVVARFANLAGANGRPNSFTADHMIKSGFHMQATLPFANGISKRMPPIIKMMDWYFVIDNILDDPSEMGADPARADKLVDSVLTVFQGSYIHPSSNPNPLVRILTDTAAEWWGEMCEEMPPAQKARLSKAFQDYLEANRLQVPYRNARHLPNMETYFQIRSDSSGWWPCAVLIEHSLGMELDEESLTHPLLLALQQNVLHHIFLVNDLTSFKKEYMQGDFCNIVSILYFKKLFHPAHSSTPAPTLQEVVLEAWQMIKEKDQECVRLMGAIKRCNRLMQKPSMALYLEGLALWMSGTIYWHLVSGRYGICATTDMHVQPPDFLAHHQVDIGPNQEANGCVPCSVLTS